jgi:hypothetical protein
MTLIPLIKLPHLAFPLPSGWMGRLGPMGLLLICLLLGDSNF